MGWGVQRPVVLVRGGGWVHGAVATNSGVVMGGAGAGHWVALVQGWEALGNAGTGHWEALGALMQGTGRPWEH